MKKTTPTGAGITSRKINKNIKCLSSKNPCHNNPYINSLKIPAPFFIINTKYLNDLQQKGIIYLVFILNKYSQIFEKKVCSKLINYIDLEKFLLKGWLCFNMDKFEKFIIRKGYKKRQTSIRNFVKKYYGNSLCKIIEDIINTSVDLAMETLEEPNSSEETF